MMTIRRIYPLHPLVAQRIAAGEVIERPASVIRELVDNAIDAQATSITVQLEEGGIQRISVIDNGVGIHPEDLPLCCRSHATSKVSSLEDLYQLSTMGFRGEALYSIASCAKVTISSCIEGGEPKTFVVDNGIEGELIPSGMSKVGTSVDVEHLFESIPARRLFLKRPATEALMCKNTLIEKAIAFPEISFRLYEGNTLKLDLPARDQKQRILEALEHDRHLIPSEMREIEDHGGSFSLHAITSTVNCYRTDRSRISVYINKRPVEEYALVQAITYGYSELLPGGSFPYCYLFVTIDPQLVDFNIHPTKREVKLRNKTEIHHQIVVMIRKNITITQKHTPLPLQHEFIAETVVSEAPIKSGNYSFQHTSKNEEKPKDSTWFDRAKDLLQKQPKEHQVQEIILKEQDEFLYKGQLFSLFLLVESGSSLLLIDQHAAHERIIFDQLRKQKEIQPLMFPVTFDVSRDVDQFLTTHHDSYTKFGLKLTKESDLHWELHTIPASLKPLERLVVSFLSSQHVGDLNELEKELYATMACHSAIRDGDSIDGHLAKEIIRQVLYMEHPVCPHGRSFIVEVTEESLWKAVGRIT